jgi:phage terminase large subunit-like protein
VAIKSKSPRASRGKAETRAERNIRWIEGWLRIPEGRDVGQPVKLRQWQKAELRKIYDNEVLTRRAILSFGRKNGKTALAAFLLLLHLCGPEARANSQLFSAAQSRDQAAVLFALAAKMVRMNPLLDVGQGGVVGIRDTAKQLFCTELGTLYRALSADASTAYGLSPVFIVHDELGQVKGPKSELYEALETATGAQENPLSIIISTQAPTDADLLSILIDDALRGADKRTVVSLYKAGDELDAFSVEAMKAANPAFGDFQNAVETKAMAADASRMPSRQPEFENLVLNRRVEMNAPFVSRVTWAKCGGEVVESFAGLPVYGGLISRRYPTLPPWCLVAPVEGIWHVKPTFWLPGANLREKSRADRVPYDVWAKDGFLTPTPGKTSITSMSRSISAGFSSLGYPQDRLRRMELAASEALAVQGGLHGRPARG